MSQKFKSSSKSLLEHLGLSEDSTSQYLQKHGKSFNFARLFLSSHIAKKSQDLYAFCRVLDDLVDVDTIEQSSYESLGFLNALKSKITCESSNGYSNLSSRLSIQTQPILDLLEGMYHDIYKKSIDDFEALERYSYQVAGTVGLMMCDLLSIHGDEARARAIDLGIAMQLTNIVRDVEHDAKIGRIYLPQCWLGVTNPIELINPKDNIKNKIIYAIKKTLKASDHFYKSGLMGLKYIPFRERFSILVAASIYRAIGTKVKANQYFQPGIRAFVPMREKVFLTLLAVLQFIQTGGAKKFS